MKVAYLMVYVIGLEYLIPGLAGVHTDAGLTGSPIQIVSVAGNHTFKLEEENLCSILNREDVKNNPVVVVSVAGAFRKGKSFLLNFFIRYLDHVRKSENFSDDGWLDDEVRVLGGFSWRGGAERETTGILMWSEPFIIKSNGQEVAVLLLDTQGSFDSESTAKESATIFSLSTMISSVLVYNLQSNIQEDGLQHLQFFTEYGKLAASDTEDIKPFQSLLFLVRDWSYPYDYDYGIEGGNKLLAKRLQLSPSQHEELQLPREHIRSCFETINCYLMPHPGQGVATNPKFDGRVSDVDKQFKEHLSQLVPQLLNKTNLIVKKISGNTVTGQDLIEYFRVYMKIFQGDSLPEPKSLVHATAVANNLVALTAAKSLYTSRMELTCGEDIPYLDSDELKQAHAIFKQLAVEAFHHVKKMGGAEFSSSYLDALEQYILQDWENFSAANTEKWAKWSRDTFLLIVQIVVGFGSALGVIWGKFKPVQGTREVEARTSILGQEVFGLIGQEASISGLVLVEVTAISLMPLVPLVITRHLAVVKNGSNRRMLL